MQLNKVDDELMKSNGHVLVGMYNQRIGLYWQITICIDKCTNCIFCICIEVVANWRAHRLTFYPTNHERAVRHYMGCDDNRRGHKPQGVKPHVVNSLWRSAFYINDALDHILCICLLCVCVFCICVLCICVLCICVLCICCCPFVTYNAQCIWNLLLCTWQHFAFNWLLALFCGPVALTVKMHKDCIFD